MKERQILFSGAMVRAILAGTKTQTRRVMKPQPEMKDFGNGVQPWMPVGGIHVDRWNCPHGKPLDRLWVRENGWERPAFGRQVDRKVRKQRAED